MEDCGHVAGGGEVASAGSFLEVTQGVVAGFGAELQQMGAEGGPGGFVGESGEEPVDGVEVGGASAERCSAAT